MADIQMPQLGETVTEGTITKWFKNVGDQVAEDEPLFEVSTDKVDSEVPSPVSGVLSEILVQEGDTVDVGVVLARVGDAPAGGGDAPAEAPAEPEAGEEPAPAAQAEAPAEAEAPPQADGDEGAGEPQPEAPPEAQPEAEGPSQPAPAPAAEQPAPAPAQAPAPAPAGGDGAQGSNGLLLSPVVRRLIAENDLDPAAISGTGPGGRITRNDVLSALDQGGAQAATAAQPAVPAAPAAPA
ncbi:MAG TPA: biotin/lipoyl-containing protein, partial [Acidimicrobiales bacterium]|nr:biotin/lipoyl-containing protein [Acidimicrobiales bacterium]